MSSATEPINSSDPVVEETHTVSTSTSSPPSSPVIKKTTVLEDKGYPQDLWAIIATIVAVLALLLAFVAMGVAKNAHNRLDNFVMQTHYNEQSNSQHDKGHPSHYGVPCGCIQDHIQPRTYDQQGYSGSDTEFFSDPTNPGWSSGTTGGESSVDEGWMSIPDGEMSTSR